MCYNNDTGGDYVDIFNEYPAEELYISYGKSDDPDNNDFYFHIHDKCEIYYFVRGEAEYLVEGSIYPLTRGSTLIMRPGESHRVKILGKNTYERYAINFPLSVFDSFDPKRTLMRPFTDRPLGKRNHYTPDVTQNLFSGMCLDKLDIYSRKVRIMTALVILSDCIGREFSRSVPVHDEKVTAAEEIINYINTHLFDEMSVDSLAAHFYLSRSQFSRIFRQATGASPWDYIIAKRLIAAKEMISNGTSASNAAACCGFGDYSCFYRAYVKRFGNSPKP